MSDVATRIVEEALRLPPTERMLVVEQLLTSLDRPDARMDELWAREAEGRLKAYHQGQLDAMPAEEVWSELEQA